MKDRNLCSLKVEGWGVKLCNHCNCSVDDCSNVSNSIYFVDEAWLPELAKKCNNSPLIIDHDSKYVIGRITDAVYVKGEGIRVSSIINDTHFLSHMKKAYEEYCNKKKVRLRLTDWVKHIYPAYSISSRETDFEHMSLVMTPGRKGTNVVYTDEPQSLLLIRSENDDIRDHIFGYASIYLTEPDRRNYLSKSNRSSLYPIDNYFLRADRDPIKMTDASTDNVGNDSGVAGVSNVVVDQQSTRQAPIEQPQQPSQVSSQIQLEKQRVIENQDANKQQQFFVNQQENPSLSNNATTMMNNRVNQIQQQQDPNQMPQLLQQQQQQPSQPQQPRNPTSQTEMQFNHPPQQPQIQQYNEPLQQQQQQQQQPSLQTYQNDIDAEMDYCQNDSMRYNVQQPTRINATPNQQLQQQQQQHQQQPPIVPTINQNQIHQQPFNNNAIGTQSQNSNYVDNQTGQYQQQMNDEMNNRQQQQTHKRSASAMEEENGGGDSEYFNMNKKLKNVTDMQTMTFETVRQLANAVDKLQENMRSWQKLPVQNNAPMQTPVKEQDMNMLYDQNVSQQRQQQQQRRQPSIVGQQRNQQQFQQQQRHQSAYENTNEEARRLPFKNYFNSPQRLQQQQSQQRLPPISSLFNNNNGRDSGYNHNGIFGNNSNYDYRYNGGNKHTGMIQANREPVYQRRDPHELKLLFGTKLKSNILDKLFNNDVNC